MRFANESPGRLVQISISNGGLPKHALTRAAMVGSEGVEGDRHIHLKFHGGPDKAVLMVAAEVVDALAGEGYPVRYGSLGENFTVRGLDPHGWRAGQRYRVGHDVVIELTTLRIPCNSLLVFGSADHGPVGPRLYDARCKARDITSSVWAHGGFYARVVKGGLAPAGALVTLESDIA